jgi:hypothetical protein
VRVVVRAVRRTVCAQLIEVHTYAFHELLRHVSMHCAERGLLLAKVWVGFGGLMKELLTKLGEQNATLHDHVAEVADENGELQRKLVVEPGSQLQIDELKRKNVKLEIDVDRLKAQVTRLFDKEFVLNDEVQRLSAELSEQRKLTLKWLPNIEQYASEFNVEKILEKPLYVKWLSARLHTASPSDWLKTDLFRGCIALADCDVHNIVQLRLTLDQFLDHAFHVEAHKGKMVRQLHADLEVSKYSVTVEQRNVEAMAEKLRCVTGVPLSARGALHRQLRVVRQARPSGERDAQLQARRHDAPRGD